MSHGCAPAEQEPEEAGKAKLLVALPTEYNTPDGADVDSDGNIYLSIPNFSNDYLLDKGEIAAPAPPVMAKIDKNNQVTTWYAFTEEDMNRETGRIGPMDAAFGPDGNLYVADMQVLWNAEHKSRLLRINVEAGEAVSMDVVVEDFIAANGMVWKDSTLFVTESILVIPPAVEEGEEKPPLESGVYAFTLEELQSGLITLSPYSESNADSHLIVKLQSSNSLGFGADGVTVDGAGNLYTSVVEDGLIYKTTLDNNNKAIETALFAQDANMRSSDGIIWNPRDDRIYVADLLSNAVHSVDMRGNVSTLHENGDTDGADGSLDQPVEVAIRGSELIIVNMDIAWLTPPGAAVNTEVDQPYTVSVIELE
jgi:sugar lactone lactonase YvrE